MPQITRDLLRKRAEHNEGIISTLEELTLHQEELESINGVLGMTCRKLKILYLQNNIIPRIENLTHCKELEYINLALNNISKIEGLQNCEFLKKLDLTVNFIDVDELEDSINHLVPLDRLRDLYFMGNPAEANWAGFKAYVIAKLPQITNLDGADITRSMQIQATQRLPDLEAELRALARTKRAEKRVLREAEEREKQAKSMAKASKKESRVVELDENDNEVVVEDASDDEDTTGTPYDPDEMTDNTPEAREKIYRELAKQKKEKEDRDKQNHPRERNYEKEQQAAVGEIRRKEEESGEREVKQKNEGGWDFGWDEESKPGMLILTVPVPRHLDSSLIDVDVHPTYVSVIVKSKTLRLRTLCEVKAESSKCQRAKVNGALMIIMPKVNARENVLTHNVKESSTKKAAAKIDPQGGNADKKNEIHQVTGNKSNVKTTMKPKKPSMQEQMIADALAAAEAAKGSSESRAGGTDSSLLHVQAPSAAKVDLSNIVRRPREMEKEKPTEPLFKEEIADTVFSKVSVGISEID